MKTFRSQRVPSFSVVILAFGLLSAAHAEEPTGWLLDDTLRHIGNNRFGQQCGFDQLHRVGVWGTSYSLPFRIRSKGQLTIVIEQVWGVNAPAAVRLDDRRVGEIPVNSDSTDSRCGGTWISRPVDVTPGMHHLRLIAYQWSDDIDDVAFRGIRIIADPPDLLLSYGTPTIDRLASFPTVSNWMEVLMDTTTLLATFGLLAFMVERLTHGLMLLLSYSSWWRARITGNLADPADHEAADRNRRVLSFTIGAILAVLGAIWLKLDLLLKFGVPIGTGSESLAGPVVTGLLIAAGADPIRDLLQGRDRIKHDPDPSPPIQVSGTLVLQQALPSEPKS